MWNNTSAHLHAFHLDADATLQTESKCNKEDSSSVLLVWQEEKKLLNHRSITTSTSNHEIFHALFTDNNTGSGDELILRLVPAKVHSVPRDPTLNRALTSGDCVTAGNLDFVLFIKAGGLCTSSETHLTYSPSLLSPVEPAEQIAPPQPDGKHSSARILCLTTEGPSDAQRQWAPRCDLLHFSWTPSFAADVDPYGLIFEVLHVCNLRISYWPDSWAIPSVTRWCRYVSSVFKLKYCFYPKYTHFRFIKVW